MPKNVAEYVGRILYVEDEEDAQEVICGYLEPNGIQCALASTAEAALELCKSEPFDTIVVDLALPGMDGWQLFRQLKNMPQTSHVPVVIVTAHHTTKVAIQAEQWGFANWFKKPVDNDHFLAQIKH